MASIFCKYLDGTTKICYNTESFSDIKVNGTSIGLTTTYTVNSSDEVEFVLLNNEIKEYAFNNCHLTSLKIGPGVQTIGHGAFIYCDGLTGVVIPDSVIAIEGSAFRECENLTSLKIGSGVQTIGDNAFIYCEGLTGELVIPDSVVTIGEYAFFGCSGLTSITIGSGVQTIGKQGFSFCTSLSSIKVYPQIAPTLMTTAPKNDVFYNVASGGTLYYPNGSDYSQWLDTNQYYLGYYGWNGVEMDPDTPVDPDEPITGASIFCGYLDGTTNICSYTDSFSDIKVNGVSIGLTTDYNVNASDEVEFVLTDVSLGKLSFINCTSLKSVIIGDGVERLESRIFEGCTSLESVSISDSVYTFEANYIDEVQGGISVIGGQFKGCTSLETIVIPDSVVFMGEKVFYECTSLKNVVLGSGRPYISSHMFKECTSLETIVIPDIVKEIESGAFQECTSLKNVVLGSGMERIHEYAFYECTSLETIVIPESVNRLGNYAFYYCTSLNTIYSKAIIEPSIDDGEGFKQVKTNGTLYYPTGSDYSTWLSSTSPYYLGYYGWNGVEMDPEDMPDFPTEPDEPDTPVEPDEPIVSDSVICRYKDGTSRICYYPYSISDIKVNGVSIGKTNYYNVNSSDEVEFILEGDYISGSTFNSTVGLYSVNIPNKVKTIHNRAFENCNSLVYVTIGSGCTSIGSDAFRYCESLEEITIESLTAPIVTSTSFQYVKGNGTLNYPEGSDYSTWLSTDPYYLGYYGWNGIEVDDPDEPDTPVDPEEAIFELEYVSLSNVSALGYTTTLGIFKQGITSVAVASPEWVEVSEIEDGYNIVISSNDVAESRDGIITFTAYGNDETITRELSINQNGAEIEDPDNPNPPVDPDEPDTPVEPYFEPIIIPYKIRLDFPSDGGSQYVQIDYKGATNILDATCSQSWVTITGEKGGYNYDENGIMTEQWMYNVIMEPTSFARQVNIIFSCTDVNGKIFTENHVMLYQSAPAVVNPSVVVSKNNITLDNVGDTSIVQVTYINVDEIVPPEVPDGFEIVEIERVESEDGIQIKYQIKRISPKRQNVQINFKGTTSDGKTATSSDVTLNGEPVPAEIRYRCYDITNGAITFDAEGYTAEIDIIAEGVNPPYEFSYDIEGNGIACIYNQLDWDNGDGDIHWRYRFTSAVNNGLTPYTGNLHFTYKDELTNKTITFPFYVRYANEGRMEAASTVYEYDKDGVNLNTLNGDRFSISYFNMETINNAVCDVDWLTVGEGVLDTGNYADERVKYNHSITIQPNNGPERRCIVTFSGKGIDGKDYTLEIEVKQEGTNTEKPIDEGFIELLQLSVILPADGGSDTFQVKYYDAKTIYEPELQYSWATITEESRTEPVPDTAWNGEECESVIVTYKVTAQATESGREMKVKFISDINYYDGGVVHMEKDKFVVYQLAEGSTELQGSVKLIRGDGEYTYYGGSIGWDPEVGYTDVTPGTPIISKDWCRIKDVKDKTTKDYDYYKVYELEIDTNYSEVSRTCQITFIGDCEDGTQIKVPFTITQKGYDGIVNEGEYDNYKGYFRDYEGILHSISFITNPRSDIYGDIRLAGESPVVVSYTESDTLYDPLRTSTCTVRVVSSHYLMNLYSGKAQGTQVVLRNEDSDSVEWCGYLQPNLYNQGYTSDIEEIEFEASDCLSTLQYLKYEYYYNGNGQPMIVSFKDIIDSIVKKCGIINSYAYTQKVYSNSEETKTMDFKDFSISENNFYSEEGEPWNYQEVLEETCKYFGFVCFQWGDRVYFIDYDNYSSTKSMTGYVYEKSTGWNTKTMVTLSNFNIITEDSYRGTGADMSLDDVYNKVTVNCNYYNVEHIIPDLFDDDNLTERNQLSITTLVNHSSEIGTQSSYIVYDHKNIISHFYKPIVGTNLHEVEVTPTEDDFKSKSFFKSFVGANIVDMYHLGYSDLKGRSFESKEWEKYLIISQLNRPWCKGPIVGEYDTTKYWENYNFPIMEFTHLPQIFIDNNKEVYSSNTSTGGRVPSSRASGIGSSSSTSRNDRNNNTINVNKSEHFLVIKAEAAFTPFFTEAYVPEGVEETGFGKWSNTEYGGYTFDLVKNTTRGTQNFAPALTFYLEIPQVGWWNGEKWVDYETWFEVPLEELHYSDVMWYTFKNTQNKVQTNLFLNTSGYKIQLPEAMESTAFMQFKIGMPKRFTHCNLGDDNGAAGNAYCFIKNLEMNIVSRNSALMKDEDIIFENIIDDYNVVDGPNIDLKITSDNNITYSFSTVSTRRGSDDKPTTNFRFYDLNGELILPEEAIIEKYVNQYSTPSIKETVTVDMSFTPAQLVIDSYWNKDFVIIGQEIDYQTCAQTLTLLEKK